MFNVISAQNVILKYKDSIHKNNTSFKEYLRNISSENLPILQAYAYQGHHHNIVDKHDACAGYI